MQVYIQQFVIIYLPGSRITAIDANTFFHVHNLDPGILEYKPLSLSLGHRDTTHEIHGYWPALIDVKVTSLDHLINA